VDHPKQTTEPEDAQLVLAVQRGARDRFNLLVSRYQARVEGFIDHFFHSDRFSQDLMQETFLTAFNTITQLRDPAKFRSWLLGIAYRLCLHTVRKNKMEAAVFREAGQELVRETSAPPPAKTERDLPALGLGLLSKLSHQDSLLVWLHHIEDLSYREIAELTELSEANLRQRCSRALATLRKEVAP